MKVQLIVVQGKPEGKVIPLAAPVFKIGRGETCNLRPNSDQVSREHAEFQVTAAQVTVRDLGSRNGTLVNGKAITEVHVLKDRDLVTIGLLTFAVSIQDAPIAATKPAATAPAPAAPRSASPDDVSHDDIESWLVADNASPQPDRPSGVYKGETMTITAFKEPSAKEPTAKEPSAKEPTASGPPTVAVTPPTKATPPPAAAGLPAIDAEEFERLPEGAGDPEPDLEDEEEADDDEELGVTEDPTDEFIDESNPFYVKKTPAKEPETASKPVYKDSSAAASEVLRKMMERRRSR